MVTRSGAQGPERIPAGAALAETLMAGSPSEDRVWRVDDVRRTSAGARLPGQGKVLSPAGKARSPHRGSHRGGFADICIQEEIRE